MAGDNRFEFWETRILNGNPGVHHIAGSWIYRVATGTPVTCRANAGRVVAGRGNLFSSPGNTVVVGSRVWEFYTLYGHPLRRSMRRVGDALGSRRPVPGKSPEPRDASPGPNTCTGGLTVGKSAGENPLQTRSIVGKLHREKRPGKKSSKARKKLKRIAPVRDTKCSFLVNTITYYLPFLPPSLLCLALGRGN